MGSEQGCCTGFRNRCAGRDARQSGLDRVWGTLAVIDYRLLGPIEADVDGRPLAIGGRKQRALLAVLLLSANEPVSRDCLAQQLWGKHPPAALVTALAEHGIAAHGRSGLGVWIPVQEETVIVQALGEQGWAVSPGERFRYRTAPGIRVTTVTLQPADARRLASDIATAVGHRATTYAG